MQKHYLQSKVKSTGTAYLFYLLFWSHYAYLGKWGLQILFWITFGGCFIWAFIDLFTMSEKVNRHNANIFSQIDRIEKEERDAEHKRNMELLNATSSNKKTDDENLTNS